eukprot:CAMPEP_0198200812 /NCGR_PEP_ID=MMETSP1445-20131203/3737_1 /TAXON_ID=36898 /ORGANISM="Pyramimonas sp., Strain CCMP2087" /LENGTH=273 /DNA_ID=CAMNT_0043870963 /DNA_START=350 /DNA_END=1168 /DNA_ORIENTATION=+
MSNTVSAPLETSNGNGNDEAQMSSAAPVQIYATTDTKLVSDFWAAKYEKEAQRNWDIFYKKNQANFFKDRHYLIREFPELQPPLEAREYAVLEVGSGAGNTVYPILDSDARVTVHCCDFSIRAVDLVKQHAQYTPERVNAFQCDITKKDLLVDVPKAGVDAVMCIFVLSAISPEMMPRAVRNIAQVLRRNARSRVFVRDYAAGDLAQERFDNKKHQKLGDNFYVRGDGTRAYYFTHDKLKELFEAEGFSTICIKTQEVEVENRAQGVKMERRW